MRCRSSCRQPGSLCNVSKSHRVFEVELFRISVELNVFILTGSSAMNQFWTIPAEVYGRLAVPFACFCVQLFTWQMSGVRDQCWCDRQNEPLWQLYYLPCRSALFHIYNVFIMLLFGYHWSKNTRIAARSSCAWIRAKQSSPYSNRE